MAIIKCKMCGGDLEVVAESRVAVCEYCGTQQTVPSADNEKKLTLFGRANRLRMACEFDKAAGVYESIVADFPEEAEAYWGLVLCKYGIEYVDDPATGKKIPTCHRSSFDSVMDDSNLDQALENADAIAQKVYREEAKQFERIRKGILEVSSSEKPYDIFICYKETDEKGDRTLDSVMAQDLYAALTDKGYRVFFSRITLQGKLGEAYEPYIFAALNSAKVMLAVGTCYEYYNAVWVKNEWSRYLKICEADKSKHLIPCYKDLDPEDMPKEFRHLQAADLGKMGAVQDILFNMEKYIPLKKETVKEPVVVQQTQNTATAPLLKRAFMFLEDGEWKRADDLCEQVLNIDPECAEAYLGKLMIDLQVRKRDELKDCAEPFDENTNYQKAVRFGDALKEELGGYIVCIENRNYENAYNAVVAKMNSVSTEEEYKQVAALFEGFDEYKDAKEFVSVCYEKAEEARKDELLARADVFMAGGMKNQYETAISLLEAISGWKDADEKIDVCKRAIADLEEKARAEAEVARLERERQEELARQEAVRKAAQKKRAKMISAIFAAVAVVAIAAIIVVAKVVIPSGQYKDAVALMESGQYEQAIVAFEELDGYKDSQKQIVACNSAILDGKYTDALALLDAGEYDEAIETFKALDGYKDSAAKIDECNIATHGEKAWEKIKNISVGDMYTFGAYEQDNNSVNGKEEIEWIVLAIKEGNLLLVSRYALDCQPYCKERGISAISWPNSSVREWLNNVFLNKAFTKEEQAAISLKLNATDNVFLLNRTQLNKYLDETSEKQCGATPYAEAQGAKTDASKRCGWWLRDGSSIGKSLLDANGNLIAVSARFVSPLGELDYDLYIEDYGIRPAIWLDLNA